LEVRGKYPEAFYVCSHGDGGGGLRLMRALKKGEWLFLLGQKQLRLLPIYIGEAPSTLIKK
jgi:hypothetical protein